MHPSGGSGHSHVTCRTLHGFSPHRSAHRSPRNPYWHHGKRAPSFFRGSEKRKLLLHEDRLRGNVRGLTPGQAACVHTLLNFLI